MHPRVDVRTVRAMSTRAIALCAAFLLACAPRPDDRDPSDAGALPDAGTAADAGADAGHDAGPVAHFVERERLEWRQAGGEPGRSTWNLSAALPSYSLLWEVEVFTDHGAMGRKMEAMQGTPLVLGDTVLAQGSTAVVAFALGSGAEKWRVERETVRGEGVIANDQAVLALSGVVARDVATGQERWRRDDLAATGSLLWDGESVLVPIAGAAGGGVVVLDPATGTTRRTIELDAGITSFASCDGALVAATDDGRVVAWNPALSAIAWERSVVTGPAGWRGGVRCASHRVAVYTEHGSRLVILDVATGEVAWELATEGQWRFALGGDLVALGRDATESFMRVLDLETGHERWRTQETASPVAIFDGAVLTNLGLGRDARTVLLEAASGAPRGSAIYANTAYSTAISCGLLIGGGRGATVHGPTFRILGDPARVGSCEPSIAY